MTKSRFLLAPFASCILFAVGCSSSPDEATVADVGADDAPIDGGSLDDAHVEHDTLDDAGTTDAVPETTTPPSDTGGVDGSTDPDDAGTDTGLPVTAHDLWVATTGSDSNPGTEKLPFATILHASKVAVADTTVHVMPGTYTGGFRTDTSGTAKGRIYYVSTVRHGAKIVPPTSSSSATGWDNRGAYVTIDGFQIDGSVDPNTGKLWTVGLNLAGEGDVASHNLVHHIFQNGTPSGSGGAGILLDAWYGFNDMQAVANIVHHVGPAGTASGWYHGIYQTATGSITNNLVYANSGGGIHLWHDAHQIDVVNNTSFGNNIGFIVGGGDFVHTKGPCDYVRVANNIAYDNTTIGFDEEGVVGTHNVFTHNLSVKNGTDWRLKLTGHTFDVTTPPVFVKYIRAGGGDYHLASGSPGIDAGSSSYSTPLDLDDHPRTYGAVVDVGAYEWRP